MFNTLIRGAVSGAGFGLAFYTVGTLWMIVVMPRLAFTSTQPMLAPDAQPPERVLDALTPPIDDASRYLGGTNSYDGRIEPKLDQVLAGGAARIVGRVFSGDAPVEGLSLRLLLNDGIHTGWASSDAGGNYRIAVPAGRYQIVGYEIDRDSADELLPGKIMAPRQGIRSEPFEARLDHPAHGLHFRFVDPVELIPPDTQQSVRRPIELRWQPVPGASSYQVQLHVMDSPHSWGGRRLFEWRERPRVTAPHYRIEAGSALLKVGGFYRLSIHALDASDRILNETPSRGSGYHFEVID